MNNLIIAIGLVLVFLFGCTANPADLNNNIEPQKTNERETILLTPDEISKHSSKQNCWIVINSKVYDFSNFNHPGDPSRHIQFCGKDGTAIFDSKHNEAVKKQIESKFLGTLNNACINCK